MLRHPVCSTRAATGAIDASEQKKVRFRTHSSSLLVHCRINEVIVSRKVGLHDNLSGRINAPLIMSTLAVLAEGIRGTRIRKGLQYSHQSNEVT
jgi:hypothetical protein